MRRSVFTLLWWWLGIALVLAVVCRGSHVTETTGADCSEQEHQCSNGFCIPVEFRCDGVNDCDDSSDERDCDDSSATCDEDSYNCANRICVPRINVCDGVDDCGDRSDETNCDVHHECGSEDQYSCRNGRCVSRNLECDGRDDCGDGSDENDCPKTDEGVCRRGHFLCTSGECTPLRPDEDCIGRDGRECPFCWQISDPIPSTNLTYRGTGNDVMCTPPYTPVGGMCLLRIVEPTSWDQARKTCRHFYGYLAELDSLEDLIVVVKHLEQKEVPWPYWVGLYLYDERQFHHSGHYGQMHWAAGNRGRQFASLVINDIDTERSKCGFIPFSYGKELSAHIAVTSNCDSRYIPLCRSYPFEQSHRHRF